MKINTSDLVTKVSTCTGLAAVDVKLALDEAIRQIKKLTASGATVALSGLGKFVPFDRPARTIIAPRTGEAVESPAMRVLKFKPSASSRRLL